MKDAHAVILQALHNTDAECLVRSCNTVLPAQQRAGPHLRVGAGQSSGASPQLCHLQVEQEGGWIKMSKLLTSRSVVSRAAQDDSGVA